MVALLKALPIVDINAIQNNTGTNMTSGNGCVGSGSGGDRNSRRKESRSPAICLVDGISHLLFQIMKGVKEQFHSGMSKLLPVLLGACRPGNENEDESGAEEKAAEAGKKRKRKRVETSAAQMAPAVLRARRGNNFLVLQGTLFLMCEHTRAAQRDCDSVWQILHNSSDSALESWEAQSLSLSDEDISTYLCRMVSLLTRYAIQCSVCKYVVQRNRRKIIGSL